MTTSTADLPLRPAPRADVFRFDAEPVALGATAWAGVLLAVAAGFMALLTPMGSPGSLAEFLPAILFAAIPLAAWRLAAGPRAWTLFRRVGVRDVGFAFAIALLNIAVTAGMGLFVTWLSGANANPAVEVLAEASTRERILFFLQTLPQLLGEELQTILPFLAVYAGLRSRRVGLSRRGALAGAWLAASLLFGLVHLPTYQWNWLQCVLVIGTARVVLLVAFLKTGNVWVATLAHVFNDWLLFGGILVLTAVAGGA